VRLGAAAVRPDVRLPRRAGRRGVGREAGPARRLPVRARAQRAGLARPAGAVHRPEPHLPAVAAPAHPPARPDPRDHHPRRHPPRGRGGDQPALHGRRDGHRPGRHGLGQPAHPDVRLPRRRGRRHRPDRGHRHRGRPSACVQRPGGRLQPVVPRGRPADHPPGSGKRAGGDARRPDAGPWAGVSRPVGDARQHPGDRAVREARLRAGARLLREAQEPDQRAAVRRRPGRGHRGPQPVCPDHRRRGAAPRDRGQRRRRRVGAAAPRPRRADRAHPRVALRADQRGRGGPLRRQAADPPAARRRGAERPGRAQGRRRRGRPGVPGRGR
jgi:hypothetical protein